MADLTKPGVKVAVCAEQVPCGAAAKKALDAAKVKLTPVTFEQDVKAALAKARLGEVDAALVYRTDAKAAAKDVEGIEFPESAGAINTYPICALKDAPNAALAKAFVEYVLSEKAKASPGRRRVPDALSREGWSLRRAARGGEPVNGDLRATPSTARR